MKLLVVGATGSLGQAVIAEAIDRDHDVSALVRDLASSNLPPAVRKLHGDVLDPATLESAVAGQDAVICALGTPSPRKASSLLEKGTSNLVDAMTRSDVQRLVCVTLLGVAGSEHNASPFYRHVILRALAPMVPDKENQERIVRESALQWVIVRPPRFVNGDRHAQPRVIRSGEKEQVGRVGRQQLAGVLIDACERPDYVDQAIVVGS
jgi:putative NADH-flavin reductase